MVDNFQGTAEELTTLHTYVKLVRATETVTSTTHKHLAREKLTISQFGVLEALHHLGPMCQRDVAAKILKSTANLTTVIDNLEKRGLVERVRSSEDRRYISLHLTEAGIALVKRIFPEHIRGMVQCFSVLSADEQAQLAALCKKLGLGRKGG